MYVSEIRQISNYRNLSGITMRFDKSVNFIVGENNLGKTNILELLNTVFSVGKFREEDFENVLEPIVVKITIGYSDDEIGFFEDNFDVEDSNLITIVARQDSIDERIEYYHDVPMEIRLSSSIIRKINVLYYYAQRMPSKEVDFRRSSGSGKVLNYLMSHAFEKAGINEFDVFKEEELTSIINDINQQLSGLNTITGDNVRAYIDSNTDKIVCRMLGLGDENGRDLSYLGEGIQYAFNILLQIVEIVYSTKNSRKPEAFEDRLVNVNGKRLFPLVLILDEPEVHQHPYRQRSLMKKIQDVMNNKNSTFTGLLNELFGIDGVVGQIFIATHSPNILLNEYTQFIRVYRNKQNELSVICGSEMELDNTLYKHMLRSFVYLKEAMFSKCVLFVEGDTENGAMPIFASRLGFDYDENGIAVIKLDGADSVKNCMDLYSEFGIPSIAMIDRDKYESYKDISNIHFTNGKDFEEDVYDSFKLVDYIKCSKELENANHFRAILRSHHVEIDQRDFMNAIDFIEIEEELQQAIKSEIKESELDELRRSKNASKASILAEYVTNVPEAFKTVIEALRTEVI